MGLGKWLQSGMSGEEYAAFIRMTHEKERLDLIHVAAVGSIVFVMWDLYDYFINPAMWVSIAISRFAIIVPFMIYNVLVARGVLPYGSLTKYVNSLPAAYHTAYLATIVEFHYYAFSMALILVAVGSSRIWRLKEFLIFALLFFVPSFFLWASAESLIFTQALLLNFLVVTSLFASFGAALSKHSFMALLHKQKLSQMEQERGILDERLKSAGRAAFQAEHLGLFLHDIKNVLYQVDMIADMGEIDLHATKSIMGTLRMSSSFARNKIEGFLAQLTTGKATKQILGLRDEIKFVEEIAQYEVRHKSIHLEFDYGNITADAKVWAVKGSIPTILFNLIRNSASAIARANTQEPRSGNAATISVTARTSEGHLIVTVNDNGDSVTPEFLAAFKSGKYIKSAEGERVGLGTYAMRVEARANGGSVDLSSREGGGTTAVLTIPLRESVDLDSATADDMAGADMSQNVS